MVGWTCRRVDPVHEPSLTRGRRRDNLTATIHEEIVNVVRDPIGLRKALVEAPKLYAPPVKRHVLLDLRRARVGKLHDSRLLLRVVRRADD